MNTFVLKCDFKKKPMSFLLSFTINFKSFISIQAEVTFVGMFNGNVKRGKA